MQPPSPLPNLPLENHQRTRNDLVVFSELFRSRENRNVACYHLEKDDKKSCERVNVQLGLTVSADEAFAETHTQTEEEDPDDTAH